MNTNGVDETTDKSVVLSDELFKIFGTSAPAGDTQINSTKTKQISTGFVYCSGDVNIGGRFRTPIRAARGIAVPAGSASAPSIMMGSASVGLFASGTTVATTGPLQVGGAITTPSGNLVLNPAGSAVDFSGKSIINAAGGGIPAIGNPNEVIVNDALGALTSEAQLAPVRGGTGINTSAATGFPRVTAGTWSVAPLTGADFGGTLTLSELTVEGPIHQRFDETRSAHFLIDRTITFDDVPATVISFETREGEFGGSYTIRGQIAMLEQDTGLTGAITFMAKAKNIAGVITVSGPIGVGKILDAPLTADVTLGTTDENVDIIVTGPFGRIISWLARIDVVELTL